MVKNTKKLSTHTRIPDKDLNIYGGSYSFENEEEFYKILYEYVFVKKKMNI